MWTVEWIRCLLQPDFVRLAPPLLHMTILTTGQIYLQIVFIGQSEIIMPPPLGPGALSDDARLTPVCLTAVCRVHRA